MIDAFSRFAVGKVLKSKEADEVIKHLELDWFCTLGRPSGGMWSDNGKEFRNEKMFAFAKKWGLEMKFGPPYSPWSNGLNEKNHGAADKAVRKYLADHPRASLQEAVSYGQWTHNTNTSRAGYVHLQLMTGKKASFPGLVRTDKDVVTLEEHMRCHF